MLLDSCMLLEVSVVHSSLFLSSISLYKYTIVSLIHSPVDRQLSCFLFSLLVWIKLLWIFIYKFLYLGVKLLGHTAYFFKYIKNCLIVVKVIYYFILPPTIYESSCCSTFLPTFIFLCLFILVKRNHISLWIYFILPR